MNQFSNHKPVNNHEIPGGSAHQPLSGLPANDIDLSFVHAAEYCAPGELLDSQLERSMGYVRVPQHAGELVCGYLNDLHPEMMGRAQELIDSVRSSGFEVSVSYFRSLSGGTPIIRLTIVDPVSGATCIPNINLSFDDPIDNLRYGGQAGKKKLSSFGTDSEEHEELQDFHHAIRMEYFPEGSEVHVIIQAPEDGSSVTARPYAPFLMRPQFSPDAFEIALQHAEMKISSGGTDYSYVCDELLIPLLQQEIHETSGTYFGIRETPRIVNKESRQGKAGVFTITAFVPSYAENKAIDFSYVVRDSSAEHEPFVNALKV